jgi:hypothetical protein
MRGNVHRHASARLAVVHNGIIENFKAPGDELSNRTIDIAGFVVEDADVHLAPRDFPVRTPAPPPFSGMNSIPADSSALRIFATLLRRAS